MKNYKNLIILGIAAVILIVFALWAYGTLVKYQILQNSNVNPSVATSKIVACTVTVYNPIGIPLIRNGDLILQGVPVCNQQYVNSCPSIFGIFSDTGNVAISGSGGIGNSVNVNVGEGSSAPATVSWCGAKTTNSLKITLRDEGNNILQMQTVSVQ